MITEGFNYNFTEEEARSFALFLRKHEHDLPRSLDPFMDTLESYFYNSMTIDEAEALFHAKIIED